uniref:Uncharacterized protein n=1 Tax=Oryza punctata TaxID=4537 RepID=A0A0E0KPQ9_ORYPU
MEKYQTYLKLLDKDTTNFSDAKLKRHEGNELSPTIFALGGGDSWVETDVPPCGSRWPSGEGSPICVRGDFYGLSNTDARRRLDGDDAASVRPA